MKRFLILPVLVGLLISIPSAHAASLSQTDLTLGSRGEGVTMLQDLLIESDSGTAARALKAAGATGYFGTRTRAALAEFQAKNGITPAAGYYGPKTRAYLAGSDASVNMGVLEAVDTGCFVDGVCSATVNGKKVILVAGLRPIDGQTPTVGTLKGVASIGDLEKEIGSVVKFYAAAAHDKGYAYTLYGDEDYYFEVLAPMPKTGTVTISGTLGCLPPLDPNKPTIALCALGLAGDDGLHYALAGDSAVIAQTGKNVTITGKFAPSTEASGFERVGTITVATAEFDQER